MKERGGRHDDEKALRTRTNGKSFRNMRRRERDKNTTNVANEVLCYGIR